MLHLSLYTVYAEHHPPFIKSVCRPQCPSVCVAARLMCGWFVRLLSNLIYTGSTGHLPATRQVATMTAEVVERMPAGVETVEANEMVQAVAIVNQADIARIYDTLIVESIKSLALQSNVAKSEKEQMSITVSKSMAAAEESDAATSDAETSNIDPPTEKLDLTDLKCEDCRQSRTLNKWRWCRGCERVLCETCVVNSKRFITFLGRKARVKAKTVFLSTPPEGSERSKPYRRLRGRRTQIERRPS